LEVSSRSHGLGVCVDIGGGNVFIADDRRDLIRVTPGEAFKFVLR
jgi:hypothetical protein